MSAATAGTLKLWLFKISKRIKTGAWRIVCLGGMAIFFSGGTHFLHVILLYDVWMLGLENVRVTRTLLMMSLPWLSSWMSIPVHSGSLVDRAWEQKGLWPWGWPSKCPVWVSERGQAPVAECLLCPKRKIVPGNVYLFLHVSKLVFFFFNFYFLQVIHTYLKNLKVHVSKEGNSKQKHNPITGRESLITLDVVSSRFSRWHLPPGILLRKEDSGQQGRRGGVQCPWLLAALVLNSCSSRHLQPHLTIFHCSCQLFQLFLFIWCQSRAGWLLFLHFPQES